MKDVKPLRRAFCILLLLAAIVTGCGGGDEDNGGDTNALGLPPGHVSVIVIDEWVRTLAKGDVKGAAQFFALPSVVENGTPPLTLRTRTDAIQFNRSLPCGAKLIGAEPRGRFIAATFRLTERPGPGTCGAGVGATARTAFVIRDGKIVQWRRLPDTAEQAPSGQPT